MDNDKLITVVIWATLAVIAYEVFKSLFGGTTTTAAPGVSIPGITTPYTPNPASYLSSADINQAASDLASGSTDFLDYPTSGEEALFSGLPIPLDAFGS